ncbi:MAG: type I secretion system permease/ATPase [Pelagibacterales bacterium]|nr:type I secretion system permease/ATPase [Pelagibacterales bacterium]|tara:strand:- start:1005 stop:2714 length:1710 start_codon:yes stop_codon:yes gene_type:complete
MENQDNLIKLALRSCGPRLGIIIFFSLFINLLMFVAPLHMLQMYDRVLVSRSEVTLLMLTALALGLLVIYGLLEGIRSKLLVRLGLKFDELMHSKLFDSVFTSSLRNPNGGAINGLQDMHIVRQFLSGGAIVALCDAPWVPIFIGVGFVFHPMLGFISLAGAIVIFVLALLNELSTKKRLVEGLGLSSKAAEEARFSLRNVDVAFGMGMVSNLKKRWMDLHDNSLGQQTVANDRAGYILAASRCTRFSLQVIILAMGGYLAIQDEITPGVMIAASIVMGRALAPVEMAVSQWRNFVSMRDSCKRLSSFLDENFKEEETMNLPSPSGNISLENAFISPPGVQNFVLSNVNIKLEPGSVTAVIGPSGCGKSSLVRAMIGIWPAARGTVRYDGANINHWQRERLGAHLGYMPQEVELFSGSVAENISRFEDVDSNEVIIAAKQAGVHDLVLKLPDGYDTQIGSGGYALSGGQRQRIALARALYRQPKILVLDEPNSSLDSAGEKALAESIKSVKDKGTTVVVVSHRPSLLSVVDKIAVLKDGALVRFDERDLVLSELGGGRVAGDPPRPANN